MREFGDAGGSEVSYDDAVRRWVALTYELDVREIDDVTFDVQYTGDERAEHSGLQLEIEVSMNDCRRYLYVREVSEFGRIITEVLDLAS